MTFAQNKHRGLTWLGLALFIFLAYLVSYLVSISIRQKPEELIPKNIERIVSLNVAATEILIDLGLEDKIVGVSFSKSNPQAIKEKPKVGRGLGNVNAEVVLALSPDIVFAYKGDAKFLREKGVPVFVVDTCNLQEVIDLVEDIGKMMGKEKEAYKIARRLKERIERIKERLKNIPNRPLVYFEAGAIGRTRASGSLTHDLITMAGGENLAKDEPVSFPLLSSEYIIAKNPDIIIVEEYGASIGEVKNRDGWQDIKAVKNNRIFRSPVYYTNYTPRCIEGLEQFARWFHPELFINEK